jgi:hypothetical protein
MSNKTKFQWFPYDTTAFENIKMITGSEVLQAYPDYGFTIGGCNDAE